MVTSTLSAMSMRAEQVPGFGGAVPVGVHRPEPDLGDAVAGLRVVLDVVLGEPFRFDKVGGRRVVEQPGLGDQAVATTRNGRRVR